MKTWFKITAKAEGAAEISIFDEIGAWGVTAKDFISELKKHAGKPVSCSINSPGGSLFDAVAIYNAFRVHGAEITTKVMGVAASAASVIFLAGDKRVMPENTFLMVHNPLTFAYGNAGELRDMADVLDKIASSMIATYSSRSGKSEDEVKAMLDAETWLTAAEALDAGFATETDVAMKVAASFDLSRLPENIKASVFEPKAISDRLSARQAAIYECHEGIVEEYGQFDQTTGANGAHYVDAAGNPFAAEGMQCANCAFFEGPRACELVSGDIDPAAICKLWVIPESMLTRQDPNPQNDQALADSIVAAVADAGFSDLASVWLLDDKMGTVEAVKESLAQAKEIRALCVAAKMPDEADKLIRNRADMPAARKHLTDILAAADEATHTSSHQNQKTNPQSSASGAAVWDKVLKPAAKK